jgi:hemoglobin/transferrin/lactoferrin receptor protein
LCLAQKDSIDQVYTLEDVVKIVFRDEATVKTISQQVKSLSARQIANLQSQNTADILMNGGGIFVQKSQQGGGSPILRGFEANKIQLVIDGVKLNNAIYRGGHLQSVITLDNKVVDRIEVLYGPSSTIYGSDALGGVIHISTISPNFSEDPAKDVKSGAFSTQYSTVNNGATVHGKFGYGKNKWATLSAFTASMFGDIRMGENTNPSLGEPFGLRKNYIKTNLDSGRDSLIINEDPYLQIGSKYSQIDLLHKSEHIINEEWLHGINIQYSTSSNIPRYDRLTDPSSSTGLEYADWYYGPQKRFLATYHIDKKIKGGNLWKSQIYYQKIEESRHTRKYNDKLLTSRIEDLSIIGFTSDKSSLKGKHHFRYGMDGQFNSLNSIAFRSHIVDGQKSPADTRYPDGDNFMFQIGTYLSHSWYISDKFTINDGIRIGYGSLKSTFINKDFFPFPFNTASQSTPLYSGSVGLSYLLAKRSKVYGQVSSGFRMPNIDDMSKVFDSNNSTLIVPNPELGAEKTYNIEIGAIVTPVKGLQVQTVIYQTTLFDAILVDNFLLDGQSMVRYNGNIVRIVANQNKGKARVLGLFTEVNYRFKDHWYLGAYYNLTQGRSISDNSGKPLDHIPPAYGRVFCSYVEQKWGIEIYSIFNGWKRLEDYSDSGEDNLQYATSKGMPSWYTLNVKANYKVSSKLHIYGSIENLLDLQYRYFASGINAGGRNLSFTLRWNW